MTAHLSDLVLDRLLTGEAVEPDPRAHLEACGECAARLAALRREADAFARAAPIAALAATTRQRLARDGWRARRRRFGYAALAIVPAAAALLVLWWRAPVEMVRTKGGLALDVFRKPVAGAVEVLAPSGEAHPGDGLRFRLSTPRAGFITIVSIDGAGMVSSYFPDAPELAPIAKGQAQLLDGAVELDATLGPERLLALVCAERLHTRDVRDAVAAELTRVAGDARRLDLARLPPGCQAASFWFAKVPAR
jgi:hypothetical protein